MLFRSPSDSTLDRPWFEKAFGPYYEDLYGHRDEDEARAAVTLLADHLPVAAGSDGRRLPILDIASGAGRHMAALNDRGLPSFGLDLSRHLLGSAAAIVPGRIVRGDMRRLPFRTGAFGAAISMFTSFGYFNGLDENRRVLDEARRVTALGGGLALDFLNAGPTLAALVPASTRTAGRYRAEERRSIETGADGLKRIVKTVAIFDGDDPVDRLREEVLALTPDDLAGLITGAGFTIEHRFGDYFSGAFDPAVSPRCLLIGRAA